METVEYIKKFPTKTFRRGELIIGQGDGIDCLLAVRTGFIKVTSINSAGVERIVWIAGRYDLIPVEQLFAQRAVARFFYTALTDGEYYCVDKASFLEQARSNPLLMTEVARGMADHYDDLMSHLTAVEATTVRESLLRALCYIADRLSGEAEVDLHTLGFRLTHQDFAAIVGATRETVTLELLKLRNDKLIQYDKARFIVYVDKIKHTLE